MRKSQCWVFDVSSCKQELRRNSVSSSFPSRPPKLGSAITATAWLSPGLSGPCSTRGHVPTLPPSKFRPRAWLQWRGLLSSRGLILIPVACRQPFRAARPSIQPCPFSTFALTGFFTSALLTFWCGADLFFAGCLAAFPDFYP